MQTTSEIMATKRAASRLRGSGQGDRGNMGQPIEVDDAIVLLMGTQVPGMPSGEISGITRLEKLIFLLERETNSSEWLSESADFEPYNFGPFSQKVYQAVDNLAAASIVDDSSKASRTDEDTWEERAEIGTWDAQLRTDADKYVTRDFRLTERGLRYFDALQIELSRRSRLELEEFKHRFASLPLGQLIRYVYRKYPAYTTKSLIRDQVLGDK